MATSLVLASRKNVPGMLRQSENKSAWQCSFPLMASHTPTFLCIYSDFYGHSMLSPSNSIRFACVFSFSCGTFIPDNALYIIQAWIWAQGYKCHKLEGILFSSCFPRSARFSLVPTNQKISSSLPFYSFLSKFYSWRMHSYIHRSIIWIIGLFQYCRQYGIAAGNPQKSAIPSP